MGDRLDGKVALVTGGSRGIGRAIAVTLAREGADVIVNYFQQRASAEAVVQRIREIGRNAISIQADVAHRPAVTAMLEEVERTFSRLDILINNAGNWRPGMAITMDHDLLDDLWSVNLKGALNCAQSAAPFMVRQGYGRIVNISSVAGLVMATPNNTPYTLTKAALIALTKRLALELGPRINVNAVCPGLIATEMMATEEADTTTHGIINRTILARAGTPEEVASCVLFLASDEASFVTAQALTVDGGRMDYLSRSG